MPSVLINAITPHGGEEMAEGEQFQGSSAPIFTPAHSGNDLALSTAHCLEQQCEVTLPPILQGTQDTEDHSPEPPGGSPQEHCVYEFSG